MIHFGITTPLTKDNDTWKAIGRLGTDLAVGDIFTSFEASYLIKEMTQDTAPVYGKKAPIPINLKILSIWAYGKYREKWYHGSTAQLVLEGNADGVSDFGGLCG